MVPLGEGAPAPPGLRLHPADLLARFELGVPPLLGRGPVHALVPTLVLGQEVVPVARAAPVLTNLFNVAVGFTVLAKNEEFVGNSSG